MGSWASFGFIVIHTKGLPNSTQRPHMCGRIDTRDASEPIILLRVNDAVRKKDEMAGLDTGNFASSWARAT